MEPCSLPTRSWIPGSEGRFRQRPSWPGRCPWSLPVQPLSSSSMASAPDLAHQHLRSGSGGQWARGQRAPRRPEPFQQGLTSPTPNIPDWSDHPITCHHCLDAFLVPRWNWLNSHSFIHSFHKYQSHDWRALAPRTHQQMGQARFLSSGSPAELVLKVLSREGLYTYSYDCLGASLLAQMVKNLPAMQETWVWSLGEGNGNPLYCSCLEKSMDRGARQATVHGISKSQTQLSD